VAKAIESLYGIPLPALAPGLGTFKLPVLNVGTLGGGTVPNAVPREAWFTVDLRSLDNETQARLEKEVISTTERIGKEAGVGFRMEKPIAIDYSKARPQQERFNHPLVQTALATANHFRKAGTPAIVAADVGSTDANIAVSMGIPAVAIGASANLMPHRLEESADARAIVPGIKSLIALAVALTTH
jgi:tripeptide aminopeptidase